MKTANLNLPPLIFRLNKIFHTTLFLIGLLALSSSVLAADPFRVSIKNAEFDSEKGQLKVEVSLGKKGKRTVSLWDHETDTSLAQKTTRGKEVRFRIGISSSDVPC